jgi:Tol biopolymer transport system component
MKFSFRTAIFLFLGVFLLSTMAWAQFVDPALKWKTIETPHFSVHFHEGAEGQAQLTAQVAEEAYEWWGEKLDYRPTDKIFVVIIDATDGPNGFANLAPNLSFVDFTSFAGFATGFANSESDSWEEVVGFHEYGHLADLDYVSGLSETFRKIFGRTVLPGVQEPTLLVEGIPTYGEYLARGKSRANEPRVGMMLRAMLLENNFPSYQESSFYYNRAEWPFVGSISHDIGPWFIRYLEDTYGEETYKELKKTQTSDPLWAIGSLISVNQFASVSGDFNSVYESVTGKKADVLWTEFKAWLRTQFNEQIQDIEARGITPSRQLSQNSFFSGNSRWSPDGEWVYYTHFSPGGFGGIRRIHPDGTADEAVVSGGFGDFHVTADNSKLIYSKAGVEDKFYQRRDLYSYDLETGEETRLTTGERPFSIAITPDGNSVIYSRYNWGDQTPSIARVDINTGAVTTIKEFTPDYAVEAMTLSPDGSTVAMSIYRRGGYSDIYTMPATGGDLTAVTQDRATDTAPRYTPDGEFLMFSADRNEVYNLYAYRVSNGDLFQVSNMLTGAQAPNISPAGDQQIAFTGYSSKGYDVHLMRYEPEIWTKVTNEKDTIPEWEGFPTTDYEVVDYSPIPALMPKLWNPIISSSQIGASSFSGDALFKHFWNASGGFDFGAGAPFFNFGYFFSSAPSFGINAGINANGNFVGVNVGYPLIVSAGHNQNVSAGYQRADFGDVSQTFSGTWAVNDVKGLDRSGRTTNFSLTGSLTQIAEIGSVQKAVGNLRNTFVLPFEGGHSLNLRFVGGWSNAETPELGFSVGGSQGQFMVRGIPSSVAAGQMAFSTSVEYRFPIATIEKGLGLWPIFIDDLAGDIFIDVAYAGLDPTPKYFEDLHIGYGFEARLSMNLMSYFGGPVFRFGVAQGLGQSSPELYISSGTAF